MRLSKIKGTFLLFNIQGVGTFLTGIHTPYERFPLTHGEIL
jgi:hypothetical protein